MAKSRTDLSQILHTFCNNVYFQPPANKKLDFPCIIYKLDNLNVVFADNGAYRIMDEYHVTYVTRDPDDENIRKIATLPLCKMTGTASPENLHHSYYTLYY